MTDRTITAPPDVPPDVRGDTPPATSDNVMPFDVGQAAPAGAAEVPAEEFRSPEETAPAGTETPEADDDGSAQQDAEQSGSRLPAGQLALGSASGAATVLGTLYHLLGLPGVCGSIDRTTVESCSPEVSALTAASWTALVDFPERDLWPYLSNRVGACSSEVAPAAVLR
ncbi:hypothetical protein AB0K16_45440 [Nonomuraea jabiensis]|uniref:hypothetical protein n=1 Tax=Nonomuraea jabiensis TaxID=882448 RepID=UPI0034307A15